MRILYICQGSINKENSVLIGLNNICGLDVHYVFRAENPDVKLIKFKILIDKFFDKIKYPIDRTNFNKRSILSFIKFKPDVVIIIKGTRIFPSTLKFFKSFDNSSLLINYTQDDMMGLHNQTNFFLKGLKYYDYIFTTKSYNLNESELPSLGAKEVKFVDNAFCSHYHKPFNYFYEKNIDIVFIGSAESNRANSILSLANAGFKIDVYGSMWDKKEFKFFKHKNIKINYCELRGFEYSKVISSAKIALCFLRKLNRDLQTVRSIEIPACRTAMVAEYSVEHAKLFEEGKEAIFFRNDNELIYHVEKLLSNKLLLENISSEGYNRCINSGYSYKERFERILKSIRRS
jgi:spore maturation protein CgeB